MAHTVCAGLPLSEWLATVGLVGNACGDYADIDPIDRSEGAYFSSLVYRDEAEREAFLD